MNLGKAIFFTTAILMIALPRSAASLVLCVGDDGHIELEYSRGNACFSCVEEDGHEQDAAAPRDDHCGDCVDVSLTASGEELQNNRKMSSGGGLACAPATRLRPSVLRFVAPLLPQPPPLSFSAQVALRTIRLII